jgi:hypothetical protein
MILQDDVFVAQDEPRIEVYSRNEHGRFERIEARRGERVELASVGVTLDVGAIYQNPLADEN